MIPADRAFDMQKATVRDLARVCPGSAQASSDRCLRHRSRAMRSCPGRRAAGRGAVGRSVTSRCTGSPPTAVGSRPGTTTVSVVTRGNNDCDYHAVESGIPGERWALLC